MIAPRHRVSVIIPTYNRAHLLPRALASVLAAVDDHDEIIVVDDASTDHTLQLMMGYYPRVQYVRTRHGGAGAARNVGLRRAQGDLVAFLDSDDEWEPHKIQLQREFLERRPDVLFCCSNFCSRTEDGVSTPGFLAQWHKDTRPWDEILGPGEPYSRTAPLPESCPDFPVHVGSFYLPELNSDYLATSTMMIRRREAGPALKFAEDFRISEDKACFARVAGRGFGAYFDIDLSVQWGHNGPRVSDRTHYDLACAKLLLIEQIWAADPAFFTAYEPLVHQARQKLLLKRAQWLLARGRTTEARRDLRQLDRIPLSFGMLALLPSPLARATLSLRRWITGRVSTTAP